MMWLAGIIDAWIYVEWQVLASLTNSAVFSIEASASAVTLVAVCTKSHTHSRLLTWVVTTGIHCRGGQRTFFALNERIISTMQLLLK